MSSPQEKIGETIRERNTLRAATIIFQVAVKFFTTCHVGKFYRVDTLDF